MVIARVNSLCEMGFNMPKDFTKQTSLYMSSPLRGHLGEMVKAGSIPAPPQ